MAQTWKTQDIALGAYVMLRIKREPDAGVQLRKVERKGANSMYFFRDDKDVIDGWLVDFPGSESFEFDSQVRVLKSIGHSKNGGSSGDRR
jgi:hypothetical protein